jgi:hypothetical protein
MADKHVSPERGGGGISGGDSKFGESGDTLATAGGQMSLGSWEGGRGQGFTYRYGIENRSSPVLSKTTKPEKSVGFQYKIQFSKFGRKKWKPSGFSGLSIGFRPIFYLKLKFWMKTVNPIGFPIYCSIYLVYQSMFSVFVVSVFQKFEFFEVWSSSFQWTEEIDPDWFCRFLWKPADFRWYCNTWHQGLCSVGSRMDERERRKGELDDILVEWCMRTNNEGEWLGGWHGLAAGRWWCRLQWPWHGWRHEGAGGQWSWRLCSACIGERREQGVGEGEAQSWVPLDDLNELKNPNSFKLASLETWPSRAHKIWIKILGDMIWQE